MPEISLLLPPLAFLIILGTVVGLWALAGRMRFRTDTRTVGEGRPYACGEDLPDHMIQPDYGQFLPFAFFFTVLHVVALIVATAPAAALESVAIAALYIVGALIGLVVLYRK
jgi:NADH-quinone oxidoreductase subunit A